MIEEKRDHKIYKYTNKVNGKVYIGRTCQSLAKRAGARGQCYKGCPHFWRAIQKYGWESFEAEILEEGLTDKEAAERELFWMNECNSRDKHYGYNIIDSYSCVSDELRQKHRMNTAGVNNPMYKYIYTEEQKEKMRERSSGAGNPFYGKHHSQETIDIIKRKLKVYYETHEPYMKNKKLTEEQRRKLSESKKGKHCGEDSPRYGVKHTEESKKKISEHKKGQIPWNRIRVECMETGRVFESAGIAGREMNLDNSAILKCCKGIYKTCGGYHWKFADK